MLDGAGLKDGAPVGDGGRIGPPVCGVYRVTSWLSSTRDLAYRRAMSISPADLLVPRPEGLYCPPADVYIDPMRPVARALITHGHSDHARAGHGAVLATAETLAVMAARYGSQFAGSTQAATLGAPIDLGPVRVTFHPAGHVLGSAQIAVAWRGLTIVASGDYKRQSDPTCQAYEPVRCDVFITEATFGLPIFRHPPARVEVDKLLASLALFPDRAHVVGAYSLGKAQRLMAEIRAAGHDAPIYIHGALETLTALYRAHGAQVGVIEPVRGKTAKDLAGHIVICPPGSIADLWSRRLGDPVTAFASGWMRTRARARQRGVELPLVVSDHCDWDDLIASINDTGAQEIWVTHGQEDALVHWCQKAGLKARPLRLVGYGDDGEVDEAPVSPADPSVPET